jgi:putative transcriptional regulator
VTQRARFPNLISELRKRLKLSRKQLAWQLGIFSQTIDCWENNPAILSHMISKLTEVIIQEIAAQTLKLAQARFLKLKPTDMRV